MADTVLDPTVDTQVYIKQGAGELVIGTSGILNILTGGKILAAGVQATNLGTFVDSTGGTPALTFAAITAPGANATTSLTADMTAVKNALSQTAATLQAIQVALKNAGITT
jgi:hypothetical protein